MAPTPASPATASPHRCGRPIGQAVTPSARALTTSVPRRTPPSSRMGIRPPTAATIAGRASMVPGAPSSCRPPWLLTMMPSMPSATARRASWGWSTPLSSKGPGHNARSQATSVQEAAGIEQARPFWQQGSQCRCHPRCRHSGEGEPPPAAHPPQPWRTPQHAERAPGGELRRNGEAVAHVAFAVAQYLVVGGQHRARRSRRGNARSVKARVSSRSRYMQTCIQRRPTTPAASFFDGAGRVRARAKGGAGARGRPGSGKFAVGPQSRPDRPVGPTITTGSVKPLTEQHRTLIARGTVPSSSKRQQLDLGERRLVAAQRALVLGTAIDEVENRLRQCPQCQAAPASSHAIQAPFQRASLPSFASPAATPQVLLLRSGFPPWYQPAGDRLNGSLCELSAPGTIDRRNRLGEAGLW